MPLINYRSAFADSIHIENSYDPNGSLGLMISDQAEETGPIGDSPIDILMALEEEMGCSIVEAMRFYRDTNLRSR